MHHIHTVSATFAQKLDKSQIRDFRKQVWAFVGMHQDRFHNHHFEDGQVTGNMHRYPQIQYRTYKGFANLWGVNEGAEEVLKLIDSQIFVPLMYPLEENRNAEVAILPPEKPRLYKAFGYIPFEKRNYQAYKAAADMQERIAILERVITSHLVLFCYGVGMELHKDELIQVRLHDITNMGRAPYVIAATKERLEYTSFDVSFYANINLPEQIGIGNLKSLGYGLVKSWESINR